MLVLLATLALADDFDHHTVGDMLLQPDVDDPVAQIAAHSVIDLGTATAFVASADGYVITNAHVALSRGEIVIARMSVDRQLVILDLQEIREDLDVAIYRIRMDVQPWIPLRTEAPVLHETVAVIGHPGGGPIRTSFGTVLTPHAVVDLTRSVEYSAQTWWGSSGSPVIDRAGRAMAVHWGWDSEGQYHRRLLGVPMAVASAELPLLASIADCPNPGRDLRALVEHKATAQGRWLFRLSVDGDPACADRVDAVTWHLHPTFDEPDVRITNPDDDFDQWISVWGGFPVSATVELDGRTTELAGMVGLPR